MTRTYTYRNRKTRETLSITADFAQASDTIRGNWNKSEDGNFYTPFQVADARHSPRNALRLVANWQG